MVELTKKQLRKIGEKVSGTDALEKVLLKKFPDARITIIMGHATFPPGVGVYTEDAFFNKAQAKEAMDEISSNETPSDTYHIVTGTVEELNDGEIHDTETGQTLYNLFRSIVYSSLLERLTE